MLAESGPQFMVNRVEDGVRLCDQQGGFATVLHSVAVAWSSPSLRLRFSRAAVQMCSKCWRQLVADKSYVGDVILENVINRCYDHISSLRTSVTVTAM